MAGATAAAAWRLLCAADIWDSTFKSETQQQIQITASVRGGVELGLLNKNPGALNTGI